MIKNKLNCFLYRLASYDPVKPPPQIKPKYVAIPMINLSSKEDIYKSLKPCFETLSQFAQ